MYYSNSNSSCLKKEKDNFKINNIFFLYKEFRIERS